MIEQHRFHTMSDRRIRLAHCAPMDVLAQSPRFFGWRGAVNSVAYFSTLESRA